MEERRKHSRWNIENKKATLGKGHEKKEVPIADLSSGGMRVFLNETVPIGSKVTGEFKVTPQFGTYFVEGKVIWVKESSKQSSSHEIGVKFEKINTIMNPL
ncbi:MAG: PilZ domain-containing protein [Candidatus Omnitrophota bacterium]